jgi:uncharacterized membrane protein YdjX (TVP38/TMEM64 family)
MSERRIKIGWWVWLVAGLAVAGLVVALLLWGLPLYEFMVDQERVHAWVEGLGGWGPVAIVFLEMAQVLLAPIPGQAIGVASGYLYGLWRGTLYTTIGIAIGSLIIFLLARRLGRPLALRLVGRQSMARLDDLVGRGGALFFFLIWLFPFTPDDLACVAVGLTPMSLPQFMILMLLGRLPGVFASVWVGANAAQIKPLWWGILLAVLAILALIFWRWGGHIQESILRFAERLGRHLA